MPVATKAIARDEILDRFQAALNASPYTGIVVVYDDAVQNIPTGDSVAPAGVPPGRPWLRAGIRHAGGDQASLGSVNGKRRQEMSGLVFVQVFTPFGDGQKTADSLVDVILDAFRTGGATPSGVQFRSARSAEIGKSGSWHQTNCLVNFEYDQIK